MVMLVRVICLVIAIGLPSSAWAQLQTQVVATGFARPIAVVPDPAMANVLYVVEQGGLIKVIQNGVVLATPFLDLRGPVNDSGNEQGLLGLAFSPNVATGRFFVNFTDNNGPAGNTVVARFVRAAANPLVADVSSRRDLEWSTGERSIVQPYSNHNGGNLAFGPDGYLYIGLGDGGSGGDPLNNAQSPATLLGKFLRIDVNVPDSDTKGFRIPPDNPFLDGVPVAALPEIWSFGWRNPWRYSFDDFGPGATGALIVGDVGQNNREEVDYEPSGRGARNYGWRIREGLIQTPGVPASEQPAYQPLTNPIHDYALNASQAVTGGYVYRGTQLPAAYRGRYFFADYVQSRVWSLGLSIGPTGEATTTDLVEHTAELGGAADLGGVASFGRDLQGELYLATFRGRILRITSSSVPGPPSPPSNLRAVATGSDVFLEWTASGLPPQQYLLEAGSVPGAADFGAYAMNGSQPVVFVPGVPSGTYYLRVRSVDPGGVSGASNEVGAVVKGSCTAPPPVPTNVRATIVGAQVTLQWSLPTTSDGPVAFSIDVGAGAGLSNLLVIPVDYRLRSLTAAGGSGTYYVRMRSHNGCGSSGSSNEIVIVI